MQQTWVNFSMESEEEDHESNSDEESRDNREQRDQREDSEGKEILDIDEGFMSLHAAHPSFSMEVMGWRSESLERLDHHVIDILSPPPKTNC